MLNHRLVARKSVIVTRKDWTAGRVILDKGAVIQDNRTIRLKKETPVTIAAFHASCPPSTPFDSGIPRTPRWYSYRLDSDEYFYLSQDGPKIAVFLSAPRNGFGNSVYRVVGSNEKIYFGVRDNLPKWLDVKTLKGVTPPEGEVYQGVKT